jgi:putative membrane protein insertion efficiency factor
MIFKAYRIFVSPLLHTLFGAQFGCRYIPTCSHYAEDAMRLYGFPKGLFFTFKRMLKCNPFCPGGLDEVPIPTPNTGNFTQPHGIGRQLTST